MKNNETDVTVFRTSETDSYLEAIALLDESKINYRVFDRNEGGYKTPQTVHVILVQPVDMETATSILAEIPTEIFLTQMSKPTSPEAKSIAWGQLIILEIIVLHGVIMAILKK